MGGGSGEWPHCPPTSLQCDPTPPPHPPSPTLGAGVRPGGGGCHMQGTPIKHLPEQRSVLGGGERTAGMGGTMTMRGDIGGDNSHLPALLHLGGQQGTVVAVQHGVWGGGPGGGSQFGKGSRIGRGGHEVSPPCPCASPPPPPNAPSHLNWQTAPSPGWKVGVSAPPRGRWRSAPGLGGAAAPGTASSGAVGGGPRGGLRQSQSGTWAVTGRGRWGNVGSAVGWGDEGGKRGPMDGGVLTLGGSGGGTSAGSVLLGERSCEQSGGRGGSRP